MWRERIIETRKAKGITIKMMSEMTPSKIPPETITRILNEKTGDPRISTVLELGESVGLTPWELFAETADLIAYQSFLNLQAEVDALKVDKEALAAENEALKNNVNEVVALKAENDRLRLTLEHKEEIIALHNYYNKLKQTTDDREGI
jgi:transcriptional regulator with XRE-family HTH domain